MDQVHGLNVVWFECLFHCLLEWLVVLHNSKYVNCSNRTSAILALILWTSKFVVSVTCSACCGSSCTGTCRECGNTFIVVTSVASLTLLIVMSVPILKMDSDAWYILYNGLNLPYFFWINDTRRRVWFTVLAGNEIVVYSTVVFEEWGTRSLSDVWQYGFRT